jgi:WD40 repeat protein
VHSLCCVENTYLLSGWEDGFIRCHDLATLSRQFWCLNAHRNGVTSLCVTYNLPAGADASGTMLGSNTLTNNTNLRYFVSGGGEGTVRVWKLDSREPVTQYTEHTRAVAKVLIDCKCPHILHSSGQDGSVLTFDLRTNSRRISHLCTNTLMHSMTQRADSEQEVITCDNAGRLMFWDIDYREAVLSMQDPSRTCIRCCCISPTGKYLAFAGNVY